MKNLLVGVGRSDITPEVGCQLFGYRPDLYSDGVNDRLTATAFAFTFGETNALMVTVSVCLLDNEVADFFRCEIEKKYNIPKEIIGYEEVVYNLLINSIVIFLYNCILIRYMIYSFL